MNLSDVYKLLDKAGLNPVQHTHYIHVRNGEFSAAIIDEIPDAYGGDTLLVSNTTVCHLKLYNDHSISMLREICDVADELNVTLIGFVFKEEKSWWLQNFPDIIVEDNDDEYTVTQVIRLPKTK